jgi:hypothetical protein
VLSNESKESGFSTLPMKYQQPTANSQHGKLFLLRAKESNNMTYKKRFQLFLTLLEGSNVHYAVQEDVQNYLDRALIK